MFMVAGYETDLGDKVGGGTCKLKWYGNHQDRNIEREGVFWSKIARSW